MPLIYAVDCSGGWRACTYCSWPDSDWEDEFGHIQKNTSVSKLFKFLLTNKDALVLHEPLIVS